jgi:hypothetical protein
MLIFEMILKNFKVMIRNKAHFLILLLTPLFLFSNCSINEGDDVTSPTPSTPPNQQSTIEDNSPTYSAINSQTSSAFANRIFPGFYVTLERASAKKFQINEQSLINADFRLQSRWTPRHVCIADQL